MLFISGARDVRAPASTVRQRARQLTVIVPAYNEARSVGDTIRSLQTQSVPLGRILVVDDCSTDHTAAVVRSCGVTPIRPEANTGSKAGAQNVALDHVRTEFTLALDADTVLDRDAVARLLGAFDDPGVAAVCGSVIPQRIRTLWERGRYLEYLFAFGFYKPVQDFYGKPLISSGCFSAYRTDVLRAHGGWSNRTMAEDMDLTWTLYQAGHRVRFIPEAVCYPLEPHTFHFMRKQLSRWSHGFVQNVRLHLGGIRRVPYLRSVVAVSMWDATIASIGYFLVVPLLAWHVSALFLLIYVIDLPAMLIPVLVKAAQRRDLRRALASVPAFLILRFVNAVYFLKALWAELVLRRPLRVYEKGH